MDEQLLETEKTSIKILGTNLNQEEEIELRMLEEDHKKTLYLYLMVSLVVAFINFFV